MSKGKAVAQKRKIIYSPLKKKNIQNAHREKWLLWIDTEKYSIMEGGRHICYWKLSIIFVILKENQTSFWKRETGSCKRVSISLKKVSVCYNRRKRKWKSTFGKSIDRSLTPDKGDVFINGITLYGKSSRGKRK